MNYYDIKKMLKSFVQPSINDEDPFKIELNNACQKAEEINLKKPVSEVSSKSNGKYAICEYRPLGGFEGYRGISLISGTNSKKNVEQIASSIDQSFKDKINREAIAKINDISKLLLQEFEAGRLIYVEEKPKSTPLLTKIKNFLRFK